MAWRRVELWPERDVSVKHVLLRHHADDESNVALAVVVVIQLMKKEGGGKLTARPHYDAENEAKR